MRFVKGVVLLMSAGCRRARERSAAHPAFEAVKGGMGVVRWRYPKGEGEPVFFKRTLFSEEGVRFVKGVFSWIEKNADAPVSEAPPSPHSALQRNQWAASETNI